MKRFLASVVVAATVASMSSAASVVAAGSPESGSSLLDEYARIHDALASDQAEGVSESAARIAAEARAASAPAEARAAYEQLAAAAEAMKGTDIAPLREQMMDLSKALAGLVNVAGAKEADIYYCPMAGGYWLQKAGDDELRNPYYGKSMLQCGSKVDKVED